MGHYFLDIPYQYRWIPSPALVLIQGIIVGLLPRTSSEIPERGGLCPAQDRGLPEPYGTECSR